MKVVILCGGKGTRLREETEYRPKPLVDIGGRPILWHIMMGYASFGFDEFVLCLGYKGEMIKEYFGADEFSGWKITFADTGEETNTGGRVKRVEPYVDGERFLCTYGDGVSDVDIRALVAFADKKKKIAVMTGVHPWSKYGQLKVDDDCIVEEFIEKPKLHDYINGGFFVFDRRLFDYLDDDCVLEHAPFERLAAEREIALYKHEGFWHSMDTYKDYEELNAYAEQGPLPWRTW
jgi:glucose-1-phosphate cytidylyltransferase